MRGSSSWTEPTLLNQLLQVSFASKQISLALKLSAFKKACMNFSFTNFKLPELQMMTSGKETVSFNLWVHWSYNLHLIHNSNCRLLSKKAKFHKLSHWIKMSQIKIYFMSLSYHTLFSFTRYFQLLHYSTPNHALKKRMPKVDLSCICLQTFL